MLWIDPKNHYDDCYFCSVNLMGFSANSKYLIEFPNMESALTPLKDDDSLPISIPSYDRLDSMVDNIESLEGATFVSEISADTDYTYEGTTLKAKLLSQVFLNDLVATCAFQKKK
ncbi:unnamed protein product [Lepeophtheirus salmonis]|uniref:(salmon louse) hypothetical protein n=1 Tax=Lepeophtheirus salmonis TaxID=72036 RepID=A0A7R8CYW7_LEPSM|nr:unnamed protein product [Lepeophtheirus salmonis]CAF2971998.1 unnamed protein product [Lepeophtheirus salmonis]